MLRAVSRHALEAVAGWAQTSAFAAAAVAVGASTQIGSQLQQTRGNKKSTKYVDMLLSKDVPNVGVASEMVKVKAGFARNYLYPQKLARYATRGEQRDFESSQTAEDAAALEEQRKAAKAAERLQRVLRYLSKKGVTIQRDVRQRTTIIKEPVELGEIVKAVEKQLRINVRPEMLEFDGVINQIGYYEIPLKFTVDDGTQPFVFVSVEDAETDKPSQFEETM